MSEIGGVARAVVHPPQLLFIRCRREGFVLEDLQKVGSLGKAGSWIRGEPAVGIMYGELPAGRAAHRKTAHGDPIVVDAVMLLNGIERLERVNLARELVRVAV